MYESLFILDDPEVPIPSHIVAQMEAAIQEHFKMTEAAPREERDPLKPFMGHVVDLIIKPHIIHIVNDANDTKKPIESDTDLWERFREKTGSCVSYNKFKEWLKAGGIEFKKTTVISGIDKEE